MNKKRAQVSHERTPERLLRRTPKIHNLRAPPVSRGIAKGDGERERSEASKRERERGRRKRQERGREEKQIRARQERREAERERGREREREMRWRERAGERRKGEGEEKREGERERERDKKRTSDEVQPVSGKLFLQLGIALEPLWESHDSLGHHCGPLF